MPKSVGKRVGGALYLHVSALGATTAENREAVRKAQAIAQLDAKHYNVVKIKKGSVSLLLYEDFAASPFPALLDAYTVDLTEGRVARSTYRTSDNPPILHRKELLLAEDDPRRDAFTSLTEALEARGLFQDTKNIGHRRQWEARLAAANLTLDGKRDVDLGRTGVRGSTERKRKTP